MLKKRILSLFVTFTMLIGLLTAFATVSYADVPSSGPVGENGLRWVFNESEKSTVYHRQ